MLKIPRRAHPAHRPLPASAVQETDLRGRIKERGKNSNIQILCLRPKSTPHQERRHEDDMRNGNRSEYPKAATCLIVLLTERSVVGTFDLADPITD